MKQFRCYNDQKIEIPLGKVTLVKGESGGGKTTILQALAWCLYGNIKLVAPTTLPKAKTEVTLELPQSIGGVVGTATITRRRNPCRLLLEHGTFTYEDDVAQELIVKIFGQYDVWMASCYIGQKSLNSFLTSPNSGKMELLNTIAFHTEDPVVFIETIDRVISSAEAEYKSKLEVYNRDLVTLQECLTKTDVSKALSSAQVLQVTAQVKTTVSELEAAEKRQREREVKLGVISSLREQLSSRETQRKTLENKPQFVDQVLEQLSNRYNNASIEEVNAALPFVQQLERLEREIESTRAELVLFPNSTFEKDFTEDDYRSALQQQTVYAQNLNLAKSLSVAYEQGEINAAVKTVADLLANQERLKYQAELEQLGKDLAKLRGEETVRTRVTLPDLTPRVIPEPNYEPSNSSHKRMHEQLQELAGERATLLAQMTHLEKACDIVKCPKCNGALRYQRGGLVIAETEPTSPEEISLLKQQLLSVEKKISVVQNEEKLLQTSLVLARDEYNVEMNRESVRLRGLQEETRKLQLEEQRLVLVAETRAKNIAELEKKICESPGVVEGFGKPLTAAEVSTYQLLLVKLRNLVVLAPPVVTVEHIVRCLKRQKVSTSLKELSSRKEELLRQIPGVFQQSSTETLQTYLDRLRNYQRVTQADREELRRVVEACESLLLQLGSLMIVEDQTEFIAAAKVNLEALKRSLTASEEACGVLKFHEQVTAERNLVTSLNNELADLQNLRQHAVETECRILQQVVDNVNTCIADVCESMFSRDITIALNLFKTTKTTKHTKPLVNFSIAYQGGTFDNINQISGGESDRASLALTLALNRLSSCPFLMLDESLSSLDLDMKEAAIETIRGVTNNTVIVVMHDGIQGIFDHVIDVDELH